MTLEPIDPHPLSISDRARRVMAQAAAANAKRKPARQRTAKPALSLTEVIYRGIVRRELIRGGNPEMHSPAFLAELQEGDKALTQAIAAWHERFGRRW